MYIQLPIYKSYTVTMYANTLKYNLKIWILSSTLLFLFKCDEVQNQKQNNKTIWDSQDTCRLHCMYSMYTYFVGLPIDSSYL